MVKLLLLEETLKRTVLTEDDLDDGKGIVKLKIATRNVRGISYKLEELTKELEERKIDTVIVSETKKKNKGSTDIGSYVMIYSGVPNGNWAASGVAILIRKRLRNKILGHTWISPK
jgi:exonuclease III